MKNILLFEQKLSEDKSTNDVLQYLQKGKGRKQKKRKVTTTGSGGGVGSDSNSQKKSKKKVGVVPVTRQDQEIKPATDEEIPKLKSVIDKRENDKSKKLEAKIEYRAGEIAILNKKGSNLINLQKGKPGKTPGMSDSDAGAIRGTGTEEDYRDQINTIFGLEFSSNCFDLIDKRTAFMISSLGGLTTIVMMGYITTSWSQVAAISRVIKDVSKIGDFEKFKQVQDQKRSIATFSDEIKELKSKLTPFQGAMEDREKPKTWRLKTKRIITSFLEKFSSLRRPGARLVAGANTFLAGVLIVFASMKMLKASGAIELSDETINEIALGALAYKMIDAIFAVMLGFSAIDIDITDVKSTDEQKINCAMMYAIIGAAITLTFITLVTARKKVTPNQFSKLFQDNLSKQNGNFVDAFRKTFITKANNIISKAKNNDAREKLQELRNLLSGSKTSDGKGIAGEGGYDAALKHVQETANKFENSGKKRALKEFDELGKKMLDELSVGYATTIKQFQQVAKVNFSEAKMSANQLNSKIKSNFEAIQKQIQPPAGDLPRRIGFVQPPVVPVAPRNINYSKVTEVIAETEKVFFSGDPLAAINLSRKIGKQFISKISGSENKVLRSPNSAAVLRILKGIDATKIAEGGFDSTALKRLLKTLKELKGGPGEPLKMSLTTQEVAAAYLDDLIFYKFANFPKQAKMELIRITQLVSRQVNDAAKIALPADKLPTNLKSKLPMYLGYVTIGVVSSLTGYYVFGGDPIDNIPGAPTEFNGLLPDGVNAFLNSISGTESYNNISKQLKPKVIEGALQIIFSEESATFDKFNSNYEKQSDGKKDLDTLIEEISLQAPVPKSEIAISERINEILVKFATIKQDALIDYAVRENVLSGKDTKTFGDDTQSKDPNKYARSEAAQHLIINILIFKSGLREKLNNYYSNVHNNTLERPRKVELKKLFQYDPSYIISVKNAIKVFDKYYQKDQRKEVDKKIEKLRKELRPELEQTDAPGKRIAEFATEELDNWPKGKKEKDQETWDIIAKYVSVPGGGFPNADREWVRKNIAAPEGNFGKLDDGNNRPFAWSAVFIRWVTDAAGHRLPAKGAAHKSYTDAALKKTIAATENPDSLKEGEWFYLPMKNVINNIKDKTLRDKGLMTPEELGYKPEAGDIILTEGGGDSGYHGDILLPDGRRVGGNLSDKVKTSDRTERYGVVTKNPEAFKILKDKLKESENIVNIAKEVKQMSKKNIKELVAEMLNENSGQGYAPYPYGSSVRDDEQPREDYMEEWKAFSLELVRDQSRDLAIQVAKLLVKDLELFEDVLDLAGQNQSVGEEILQKLKDSKQV